MRFNNMNFSDGHYVQIPASWDAQEFTHRFLSATPPWVRTIMQLRNRVVQKIGFTVQPASKSKQLEVAVGSSAGPFTFTEVTDEHVIGGHKDKHIEFSSKFVVTAAEEGSTSARGGIETHAQPQSAVGKVYLTCIWPFHMALVPYMLRQVDIKP